MMVLEGKGVLDVNDTLHMGNGNPTQRREFVF